MFELQVVRPDGVVDTRYTDRLVSVGDRVSIDTRSVLVLEQIASPANPIASAGFRCAEEPAGPSTASIVPATRRAA